MDQPKHRSAQQVRHNPRTGDGLNGLLNTGSVDVGQVVEVTAPDTNDWLLVVQGSGGLNLSSEQTPPAK